MIYVDADVVKENICVYACRDPLNVDNTVEHCEQTCPYMAAVDKAVEQTQQRSHHHKN